MAKEAWVIMYRTDFEDGGFMRYAGKKKLTLYKNRATAVKNLQHPNCQRLVKVILVADND